MLLNGFKQYWICYAVSCRNDVMGFGPVLRYTIMVVRKGQIRDWPKKASYLQENIVNAMLLDCLSSLSLSFCEEYHRRKYNLILQPGIHKQAKRYEAYFFHVPIANRRFQYFLQMRPLGHLPRNAKTLIPSPTTLNMRKIVKIVSM